LEFKCLRNIYIYIKFLKLLNSKYNFNTVNTTHHLSEENSQVPSVTQSVYR